MLFGSDYGALVWLALALVNSFVALYRYRLRSPFYLFK